MRRCSLGWASLLAALLLAPALSGLAAAPRTASAATTPALDQVGACIAAGGRGDVLIVMDSSGSLKSTDPGAVRVDAAQYLVNELAAFADASGAALDVSVTGFDTGFGANSAWTLVAGEAASIRQSLERYRTATSGLDTDYWAAVDGSRKALLAKAAQAPDQASCPVWFWFSDGQYDIEPRKPGQLGRTGGPKPYAPDNDLSSGQAATAAEQAGTGDLCRAGGQADQSRAAGITTIAIGLEHEDADFALMRRVAAGEGQACGELPARGQFLAADELDALFFAFDQFATPGRQPIEHTGQVCGRQVCPQGTHPFVVDSAIGTARVLAGSDVAGARLQLIAPAGEAIGIGEQNGSAAAAGARVRWQWLSPRTVQVVAERDGDSESWSGQWQLVFTDPAADAPHGTSRTSVHLIADLAPAWIDPVETLTRSATTELTLGLQRLDGQSLAPESLPSTLALSATLVGADGTEMQVATGLDKSKIGGRRTIDLSAMPIGSAELRLTLDVTTAGATTVGGTAVPGTRLAPITATYPVRIAPAPNYPSVPTTISFGEQEGAEPVTVTVPVDGPGCVWLGDTPSATTVPDGVSATLTSPAVSQDNCSTTELELTLTPSAAGNGLVSGTFQVMAAPADGPGDPVAMPVQYRLELAKPANQPLRIAVFLAVLAAGLILPLAALYALKAATARLQGTRVFAGLVRGQVDERGSFLDATGQPHLNDLDAAYITGSRRELLVPGARLRTVVGLAPTEPGYVRAELAGAAASSAAPASVGAAGRLPLDVRNQWLVGLDPLDPHGGPVQVIYLISDEAHLQTVVADARRRVPERVAQLRAGVPVSPSGPGPVTSSLAGLSAPTAPPQSSSGWSSAGPPPRPPGESTSQPDDGW